jgi:hypothetical protein
MHRRYRRNADIDIRSLERKYAASGSPEDYRRLHIARLRQGYTEQSHEILGWIEEKINSISPEETDIDSIPTWHELVVEAAAMFDTPKRKYSFHGEIYRAPLRERLFQIRQGFYDDSDLHNELESILQEMADERAAEGHSYIGDMPYYDYGEDLEPGDLWQSAEVGYAFAVDSDLLLDGRGEQVLHYTMEAMKPPENFVLLTTGGWGGSDEQELSMEFALSRLQGRFSVNEDWLTDQLFGVDGPEDLSYVSSSSADIEMYGDPDKVHEQYIA